MTYLLIPFLWFPSFEWEYEAPVTHMYYAPVETVYIEEDYQPYTHHYLPDDGSLDS